MSVMVMPALAPDTGSSSEPANEPGDGKPCQSAECTARDTSHGCGLEPRQSAWGACVRSADAGASRSSQPWSRRCSATLLRLTVGRWCDKLANESAEAAVGSHVGGFKGCRVLLYAFSKAAEKGRLGVPSFEGRLLVLTHTLCSSPAVVTCKTPVTTMAAGAAKLEVSWGLKWGQYLMNRTQLRGARRRRSSTILNENFHQKKNTTNEDDYEFVIEDDCALQTR
jgi:hypothetical protein